MRGLIDAILGAGTPKEVHKCGLIEIYRDTLDKTKPFEHALLTEAIRKLRDDVEPQRVEDWVVKMSKEWDRV